MSDQRSFELSADGHLSEGGVAAIADGQEVSVEASEHAERCEGCAARVGDAALRSLEIHRDLHALALLDADAEALPARRQEQVRQGNPALYIALALGVALLASLPGVARLPHQLAAVLSSARLQLTGLWQVARALSVEVSAPAWSFALAAVLVVGGVSVAVLGSRNSGGKSHEFA